MPPRLPTPALLEYELPCAEALLAGTLACMTAHAQSRCDRHRGLMAQKVAGNLSTLEAHPAFSPHFRAAIAKLAAQWRAAGAVASRQERTAVHLANGRLH